MIEYEQELAQYLSPRVLNGLAQRVHQEQVLDLLQIPEARLQMYREKREYLNNGGEVAQVYLQELRREQLSHHDQVTLDVKTGEARATNKHGRSAQAVAAQTFDRRWINRIHRETGKLPMAHYYAAVLGLHELWKAGIVDPKKHPKYEPWELQLMERFVADAVRYGAEELPKRYPDFVHLIVFESPLANIGNPMINVFQRIPTGVDFALTNYQAQEDGVQISDSYLGPDEVFQGTLAEKDVVMDKSLRASALAATTGTRQSMLFWRGEVDKRISKKLGVPIAQLERDLKFRNKELREYAKDLIQNEWGVPRDLTLIRKNNYILGPKHHFHKLTFEDLTLGDHHKVCPLSFEEVLASIRNGE